MQMILSKLGINSTNDKILASLSFVIFMPLLFDFIASLASGSTSNITMIIYGISFVVIITLGRRLINARNILALLVVYFICLLNITLFPESQQYFGIAQYLILLYFLPLGFIVFRTIKSWDNFIPILFLFTPFAIIMGIYVLIFAHLAESEDTFTYMEFSYALLPFVCASYAYYNIKKHIVGLLLYFIGLIEMLSFGCRGAVISAIVLAISMTILNSKRNKWSLVFLFSLIFFVAINISSIISYLSGLSLFEDSYVLNRAINETVFDVGTREHIYSNCVKRLLSMGGEISGLFGDRPYCGSVYPHNIVYEILMQWGWILGALLLLYFASLFIKAFTHNDTSRFITLYFICAILLRFFVSGSYLNSGLFWIMIVCIQSLKSTNANTTLIKIKNKS